MAERFSNRQGSHQTSLGLYRVGVEISSPKHGPALLLHGLDQGVNDQALPREVILHGADDVSAEFFRFAGRRYGGYLSRDLRDLNWFIPVARRTFRACWIHWPRGRWISRPTSPSTWSTSV
jgi:hypothetical protein